MILAVCHRKRKNICECEDIGTEAIQCERCRGKQGEHSFRDLWVIIKWSSTHIIRDSKEIFQNICNNGPKFSKFNTNNKPRDPRSSIP
jgi:hypothetical protein